MKKFLTVSSVVFALGYAAASAAVLAGFISINLFSLPVLIGGIAASNLVGLALNDYSRRPSFRVRRPHAAIARRETVIESGVPSTTWTYATHSA